MQYIETVIIKQLKAFWSWTAKSELWGEIPRSATLNFKIKIVCTNCKKSQVSRDQSKEILFAPTMKLVFPRNHSLGETHFSWYWDMEDSTKAYFVVFLVRRHRVTWIRVFQNFLTINTIYFTRLPLCHFLSVSKMHNIMVEFSEIMHSWSPNTFQAHGSLEECRPSHVRLFETPWTVAHQAPLPVEFSRQEYWSGLLFPSPGDLPDPGIELMSLMSSALAGGFFITSITWEALPRMVNPYIVRTSQIISKSSFKLYEPYCLIK